MIILICTGTSNKAFAAIGGDTDIIIFDNTNGTFSTHGTGTVTVQMTCGTWTDTFKVNIK